MFHLRLCLHAQMVTNPALVLYFLLLQILFLSEVSNLRQRKRKIICAEPWKETYTICSNNSDNVHQNSIRLSQFDHTNTAHRKYNCMSVDLLQPQKH